ncbi:MAG: hypothetical protein HY708_01095 [Ignavibacteriae bacterium]|nr:hypothetical protein [Ignavibacteriota bacterium]
MRKGVVYVATLIAFLNGCKGTLGESDSESRAEYHMMLADSLETKRALREAVLEYKLVAELYPHTSYFPIAIRNTALLYSNPLNPAVDDSAALHWFEKYLDLAPSKEERTKAEIYVTMLRRITALQREISRRTGIADSLIVAARRLGIDLAARNRRILELEADLVKSNEELQKLREVDIRINQRKAKK